MNLEKLDEAIAYIEAHPEQWRQEDWFHRGDDGCGTAACIAGTVVLLDGWTPANWTLRGTGDEITSTCEKDGFEREVDELAMDILCTNRSTWSDEDMTEDEWRVERMFAATNSIEDIKRIRDEIAASEIKAVAG